MAGASEKAPLAGTADSEAQPEPEPEVAPIGAESEPKSKYCCEREGCLQTIQERGHEHLHAVGISVGILCVALPALEVATDLTRRSPPTDLRARARRSPAN